MVKPKIETTLNACLERLEVLNRFYLISDEELEETTRPIKQLLKNKMRGKEE